ncbi:hypothetical protein ACHWQZ_G000304 [Mnemiopsis leidyi]
MTSSGHVTVVLGSQWGDEGKGKVVDLLAEQVDVVARCQGGNNAGHTVVVGETHYDFHLLPSGVVYQDVSCVIGNGVVVHVPSLFEEIDKNAAKGLSGIEDRLIISDRAHIVGDVHQTADGLFESEKQGNSLGTTKKGIGPTYSTKMQRTGLRMSDLLGDKASLQEKVKQIVQNYALRFPQHAFDAEAEFKRLESYIPRITPMIKDTVLHMNQSLNSNKRILVEGANAAMLDIDFGTYPYVTSSNCTVGGVCTGLGIPPTEITNVIGVVKAYTTRVGAGRFPTELTDEIGEAMVNIGHEYGVTTGRKRRCGWLDLMVLRYSHMVNGFTRLAVTKLDILDTFKELKVCTGYKLDGQELLSFPSDHTLLERIEPVYTTMKGWECPTVNCRTFESLPDQAKSYLNLITEFLGVKIGWIGVGQSRDSIIIV